MTLRATAVIAAVIASAALAVPGEAARGQGQSTTQPTRRDSTIQQAKRRAIDVRATAPAPEVVTIRPREIPRFPRSLLVPAMITPPAGDVRPPATVVIFPGTIPERGARTPPVGTDTSSQPPE
ncbi:MAG: hypothetical protein IT356_12310 [Gemmatimonadaceae bacterium]|nr:hypothetical protein [Gemmatimonadaceae bacterium]